MITLNTWQEIITQPRETVLRDADGYVYEIQQASLIPGRQHLNQLAVMGSEIAATESDAKYGVPVYPVTVIWTPPEPQG